MALAKWRLFRVGESLYEIDEQSDAIFGLEKGAFDILMPISDGEMVNVWRAEPGSWHGSSVLSSDKKRPTSGVARVDCLVLELPAQALLRHLDEHPHDFRYFYDLAYGHVMSTLEMLGEVIVLPPRVRFARLLLRLAATDDVVPATQKELGALTGMSRAAFRRAFSELIEAGIVQTEYGAVRILDQSALRDVADSA